MLIPFSWLRSYLVGEVHLQDVVRALTSIGLEVEFVDDPSERLKDFVVGRIEAVRKHPDADRLNICKVNRGATLGDFIEVVCGGSNVRAGMYVIFAPVGAVIPSTGQALKCGKVRGVESPGMLCSPGELLLNDIWHTPEGGVFDLTSDALGAPLHAGMPAAQALGLDDPIIDIAITPNRSDCFSILGIARDLHAYFQAQGTSTTLQNIPSSQTLPMASTPAQKDKSQAVRTGDVHLHEDMPASCYHFGLTLIEGVSNTGSHTSLAKSVQKRLLAAGQKLISPLVDITNDMCLGWGRPMHVFDADTVQGDVRVRLSEKGEVFEGLDDGTYTLDEGMLVICDDAGIISLAGIMGGKRTACSEKTVRVLLESAWFDPVTVARAGQKLRICSDARTRFERGVDPLLVAPGMARAIDMIQDMCARENQQITVHATAWVNNVSSSQSALNGTGVALTSARTQSILGQYISACEARKLLNAAGCTCTIRDDASVDEGDANTRTSAPSSINSGINEQQKHWHMHVQAPSWRPDLVEDVNFMEEMLRLKGVESISETPLPPKPPIFQKPSYTQKASRTLMSQGYHECISLSFISERSAKLFALSDSQSFAQGSVDHAPTSKTENASSPAVHASSAATSDSALMLGNPLTEDMSVMRHTLLPSLLKYVRENQARSVPSIALFECAPVYHAQAKAWPLQTLSCAGVWAGKKHRAHFRYGHPDVSALDAKDHVVRVLNAWGIKETSISMDPKGTPSFFHPARALVLRQGKKVLGYVGELHPALLKAMHIKGRVCAFELNISALPSKRHKTSAPALSPYPPVQRDFAFTMPKSASIGDISTLLFQKLTRQKTFPKHVVLENIDIFDIFDMACQDGETPCVSVALRLHIQPMERTLNEQELDDIMRTTIELVESCTQARLRQ